MKKLLPLFAMLLAGAFFLTGCSDGSNNSDTDSDNTTTTTTDDDADTPLPPSSGSVEDSINLSEHLLTANALKGKTLYFGLTDDNRKKYYEFTEEFYTDDATHTSNDLKVICHYYSLDYTQHESNDDDWYYRNGRLKTYDDSSYTGYAIYYINNKYYYSSAPEFPRTSGTGFVGSVFSATVSAGDSYSFEVKSSNIIHITISSPAVNKDYAYSYNHGMITVATSEDFGINLPAVYTGNSFVLLDEAPLCSSLPN